MCRGCDDPVPSTGERLFGPSGSVIHSIDFYSKTCKVKAWGSALFHVCREKFERVTAFSSLSDFLKCHCPPVHLASRICHIGILPVRLVSHTDPKLQHTHCNGIGLLSKSSSSRYSSPSSETKDDPWLVHNHIRNGSRSPFTSQ